MSDLFEILENIQDTEAALAVAERAAAENRESPTLSVSIKSIQKRRHELEEQFEAVTREKVLDVCSYRVFSESEGSIKITSFAGALHDFQGLFTTVFDALKNGPKQKAKIDARVAAQTAFDFGYCFSGSAGIVMTLPGELLLFGEGDLEKAIAMVFEMAGARKPEEIATLAKRVGVASVRKMYQWVSNHVQSEVGADIQWKKGNEPKFKLFIQVPQLQELRDAIAATSEETEETVELKGTLVGLDVDTRKFHMKFPDAEDMKGEMSPAIGTKQTLELPRDYKVDVLIKKKIHYSTETEEVSYFLLKIK